MSLKVDQFQVPVCNSFEPMLHNDQLCYEVDLNRFSHENNIQNELELGFYFIIDYNEDRQVTLFHNPENNDSKTELTMARNVLDYEPYKETFIYFNTIGKNIV